jgi:L-aminopeptidase/D-esterase-like protein
MNNTLTALPGVRVGHWTNLEARTGCTVILMPPGGAVASCDVRGNAPGTRETALLEPTKMVERIHALLLTGGSAFGLAAASGVMEFLEANGEGVQTPFARIPIVPAAVIFDLGTGRADIRPGHAQGLEAARLASSEAVAGGRVGAGTGGMCGKYLGVQNGQPGGLGSALVEVGGARVVALAVANPSGDVVDASGLVASGACREDGGRPTALERREAYARWGQMRYAEATNTTLVVVGTDAPLTKLDCKRLSEAAQAGISRATRPSQTMGDGDVSFAFSVGGGPEVAVMALAAAAQDAVADALVDAVRART